MQRAIVQRARMRSRARLSYAEAQAAIDDGTATGPLALLKPVGLARIELERRRGGASLNSPDEEIVLGPGGYTLRRREPLPVEDWNAQLSLMTGMAAARIMIDGGVGILRTMPAPGDEEFASFRRQTVALGLPWPDSQPYEEYLRALDRQNPAALAVLQAATSLFRGAGYVAFDTAAGRPAPHDTIQSAIAAPYAHATAPLRRLIDRWSLVICAALCAGDAVPEWARRSLTELPSIMAASARRAADLDSASINRVEAALLSDDVGRRVRGDGAVAPRRFRAGTARLTSGDGRMPCAAASVAGIAGERAAARRRHRQRKRALRGGRRTGTLMSVFRYRRVRARVSLDA